MPSTQADGYSATVQLSLRVGDEVLSVAQTGLDWLILREPRQFDSVPAQLLVKVGDKAQEYPIMLRSGDTPSKVISYW